MKKLINSMLIVLLCTVVSTAKVNDPYHLVIEGEFLSQKHIQCTVYKMGKTGTFVSESHNKFRKYYSLTCDLGGKYLIRFTDKNQNTKFLMIDVIKGGYTVVDVDFSKSYDAMLKFNLQKRGYIVAPLIDNPVAQK